MSMNEKTKHSRDIGEGVRQFIAASASAALKQVRDELGPDALILSQDRVGDRVVIEAALEMPALEEELPMEEPSTASILDDFSSIDVSEISSADVAIDSLRGVYRFVGSSGVGKTSLVIKTAVEYAMRKGVQGVVIITTDSERLAGTEQLELSCQMLGIRLISTTSAKLQGALQAYSSSDLVLIDTPAAELVAPQPIPGVIDIFTCSIEHSTTSLETQLKLCGPARYIAITHLDRPSDRAAVGRWLVDTGLETILFSASGYIPEGLEAATESSVRLYFSDAVVHPEKSAISVSI